jgi:hypothetical protein
MTQADTYTDLISVADSPAQEESAEVIPFPSVRAKKANREEVPVADAAAHEQLRMLDLGKASETELNAVAEDDKEPCEVRAANAAIMDEPPQTMSIKRWLDEELRVGDITHGQWMASVAALNAVRDVGVRWDDPRKVSAVVGDGYIAAMEALVTFDPAVGEKAGHLYSKAAAYVRNRAKEEAHPTGLRKRNKDDVLPIMVPLDAVDKARGDGRTKPKPDINKIDETDTGGQYQGSTAAIAAAADKALRQRGGSTKALGWAWKEPEAEQARDRSDKPRKPRAAFLKSPVIEDVAERGLEKIDAEITLNRLIERGLSAGLITHIDAEIMGKTAVGMSPAELAKQYDSTADGIRKRISRICSALRAETK